MFTLGQIIVAIIVLLLWWYKEDKKKYGQYPPGPFRFPIIGNLPQLLKHWNRMPALTYKALARIYGDVMFVKVGQFDTVMFSSKETIQEMLTNENTIGRHQFEFVKDRHDSRNMGIIWSYGSTWQNLRRFTLRNLRDFGFGRSMTMDVVVNEEIDKFHDWLREEVRQSSRGDNIIRLHDPFTITAVNGLWRLVAGKSFDLKDPKILKLVKLSFDWVKSTTVGSDLSEPFPILREWFPGLMGKALQEKINKEFYDFGKSMLDEQSQIGSADSLNLEPETFIDVFRQKINDCKDDSYTDFTDEQFVITILDLFLAGSETSSNTLGFGILYMVMHPEIQEKIRKEINSQVSKDEPISYSMKSRLPYTSAAVLEVYRMSTVVPLPVSRLAVEDFYFRNHFIRRGTALSFNLYAAHYDKSVWVDPENFRPERFLTPDGTSLDQKVVDNLIIFGAGKRVCLGQSLAESTIFLYFASTLRKFKFVRVPGTELEPTLEPIVGITLTPKPYDVKVVEIT